MAVKKRVKLAFIANDTARRACLRKRRTGLHKKVSELTILCDVMACLIIYSPDEPAPTVWPNPEVTRTLIDKFFALPDIERTKKAVNQETYLKDRKDKISEQLVKLKKKNLDMEMDRLLDMLTAGRSIDELAIKDMEGLIWFTQEKAKECVKRIEYIQHIPIGNRQNLSQTQPNEPQMMAAAAVAEMGAGANSSHNTGYQNPNLIHQWGFNFDNNIDNTDNNNNNNININNAGINSGAGNNPSGYQDVGQMFGGNSGYGNFRDMGLSQDKGKSIMVEDSADPNMNYGLLFHTPHEISYTNLVLGQSSYDRGNTNIAVSALNSGGLNSGLNPDGLNLGLNTNFGLQRGHHDAGTSNENQTQGEPEWGIPGNYQLGSSSGMFRGETSGAANEMGLHHDINQTWPNNDNFHQ